MAIAMFIIGLAIGSFLNAYIFRARYGGSVWKGRSHCMKCQKVLHWYELIPLFSFIFQIRRCRGCKGVIDWQYPLVELAMGILFVLSFLVQGLNWGLLVYWYLLSVLVILFIYDLRYGLVPDVVVLPAILIAFAYSLVVDFNNVWYTLMAMVVGFLFFAIQYWYSKGQWLGAGDMRIGVLMGAMAGWPLVFESLAISYVSGGVIGIFLLASQKKKFGQTVPLGTFLTFGIAVVFLYGRIIWDMYWGL